MNLLERYLKGDYLAVHAEMERMGPDPLARNNAHLVEAVLRETMQQVADR